MNDYKRLPFEHLVNCRDLGGYACGEGKMSRYHCLYRSEAPDRLTEREWAFMEKMGVRTILDLRSVSEQEFSPYEVPGFIERISYPLYEFGDPAASEKENADQELAAKAIENFAKSMEDDYCRMVEDNPSRMAALLELIAEKLEKGAILYHCAGGKDRTGVLTAVIYLFCGVSDADIIADYQVTETYLAGSPLAKMIPAEMKALLCSKAETMEKFLERAHDRDYLGLLERHGLAAETVERIRRALMR